MKLRAPVFAKSSWRGFQAHDLTAYTQNPYKRTAPKTKPSEAYKPSIPFHTCCNIDWTSLRKGPPGPKKRRHLWHIPRLRTRFLVQAYTLRVQNCPKTPVHTHSPLDYLAQRTSKTMTASGPIDLNFGWAVGRQSERLDGTNWAPLNIAGLRLACASGSSQGSRHFTAFLLDLKGAVWVPTSKPTSWTSRPWSRSG